MLNLYSDLFYDSKLVAKVNLWECVEYQLLLKLKEVGSSKSPSAAIFYGINGKKLQT